MTFWIILYAIGAAQAILLALALWRRPVNPQANRVLAVWIAIVGLDLTVKAAYLATPTPALFQTYWFVALFPFLYASAFYIYVRALTTGRGFGLRDVVHLAGFLMALACTARAFLPGAAESSEFDHYAAGDWQRLAGWFDPALFTYALGYTVAALLRVLRYRRLLRQRRSDADRQSLRWIGTMAVCQLIIWCIAATASLTRLPYVDYFLIYAAVAAWVCVVGYFSLGQPPVVEAPPVAPAPVGEVATTANDPRFEAVEARLAQLMADDGVYREPALTIGQLAKRSGYPEYLISAVINRRFGGNFWDFINRYRVEAARTCLADPDDLRTILDIAYACGFTSKSTFNVAFKRQIGDTPSGYRRQSARGLAPNAGSIRTRAG